MWTDMISTIGQIDAGAKKSQFAPSSYTAESMALSGSVKV
jgi:hypothetical protein